MYLRKVLLLIPVVLILLNGCIATHLTNPRYTETYFNSQNDSRKTILLFPPDIKCYKVTAGGVTEQIDTWMNESQLNFENAFIRELKSKYEGKVNLLDETTLAVNEKELLANQIALYDAVAQSIDLHLYNPNASFPTKKKNFDYSLGPYFGYLKNRYDIDMMAFITGINLRATMGRIFLNALQGAILGVMPVTEGSLIFFSLVDSDSGDIVWFDKKFYLYYIDLSNPLYAETIAKEFLYNVPFMKDKNR